MKPSAAQTTFSLRSVQAMLALPARVITQLVDAGFVQPTRGARNAYRFSFEDVVLLRTANQLRSARIPTHRILRALTTLRASLPDRLPLAGLRITAVGSDVTVREGGQQWEAESGQLLLDFDVRAQGQNVSFIERAAPDTSGADQPAAVGESSDAEDAGAAEAAYRQAIALDEQRVDAYVDLSALLCDSGRCDEAVRLLTAATQRFPEVADLHFNLAIALEDVQRLDEAVESYERCLALDPTLADAHFNAARLHDRLGHPHRALRHYSAYRRLPR